MKRYFENICHVRQIVKDFQNSNNVFIGHIETSMPRKKLLEPLASEGFFTVEKKFLGNKYALSDKGIETQTNDLRIKG